MRYVGLGLSTALAGTILTAWHVPGPFWSVAGIVAGVWIGYEVFGTRREP